MRTSHYGEATPIVIGLCLFASLDSHLSAQSASSIESNFNGTTIADSSFVWFNSHISGVSGVSGAVTVYFRNQQVTLTSPQTNIPYTLAVPDGEVRIDPLTVTAATGFFGDTWITTVPDGSDNPFLSGYVWDVPMGEDPKASNPVTWSGDFYASESGISIQWQWSAAVYTSLSADLNSLGVTPIDGAGASQSGTPLNFTSFLTGGARGGGGSNFTGSNSGTASVANLSLIPEPSSLSLALIGTSACVLWRKRRVI